MARAFLVALWCATATTAAGTRYGDYSGARMPQYGSPEYEAAPAQAQAREPDDYRGHSPDAPAALDYKYEEELAGVLAGKTDRPLVKDEKKDFEQMDSWQRPARKHKKKPSRSAPEHAASARDRFDPDEDFPKAKTSSRLFTKHRPRLKSRKYDSDDDAKYPTRDIHDDMQGYPISHSDKHEDTEIHGNEESGATDDYHNDKRNSLDDKSRYGRRERVARRKPRDKFERGPDRASERELDRAVDIGTDPKGLDRDLGRGLGRGLDRGLDRGSDRDFDRGSEGGIESGLERDMEKRLEKEMDTETEGEEEEKVESDMERWMLMHGGLGRAPRPSDVPSDVDVDAKRRRRPDTPIRKPFPKKSEEDDDMKEGPRAGNIKPKKSKKYDDYNDYYDMKRVMNIKSKLPSLLRRNTVREEVTAPARLPATSPAPAPVSIPGPSRSLQELLGNRRLFLPPARATRTTLAPPETTTEPPPSSTTTIANEVIPLSAKPQTVSNGTDPFVQETFNKTELSLAEKSRLSIMKKAMRKESMEGRSTTTKPPVLLQVTRKMPTVVMVEPPSSEPFLRAREVYADSPARLDKVKRLMRHKLVASARNIHDLTDNWDDLVCDYIDMSLLDQLGAATRLTTATVFVLLTPLVILIW